MNREAEFKIKIFCDLQINTSERVLWTGPMIRPGVSHENKLITYQDKVFTLSVPTSLQVKGKLLCFQTGPTISATKLSVTKMLMVSRALNTWKIPTSTHGSRKC